MNSLLYAPSDDLSRGGAWTLTGLRVLLALFFVFVAGKNLAGDAGMNADFARWGYPDWFRMATAMIQIAAAGLLLWPPLAFIGGGVLVCVLVGALATHVRHDPPVTLLSPVVFLALVGVLLYGYRPPLLR